MKDLEKKILQHLKARKWDNLRPSDVAKSIMIEGAELLEIFQWENLELAEVKKNKEKIIRTKLSFVQKKYPAKLMKKNTSKEPGTESTYWRIKKKYRKHA